MSYDDAMNQHGSDNRQPDIYALRPDMGVEVVKDVDLQYLPETPAVKCYKGNADKHSRKSIDKLTEFANNLAQKVCLKQTTERSISRSSCVSWQVMKASWQMLTPWREWSSSFVADTLEIANTPNLKLCNQIRKTNMIIIILDSKLLVYDRRVGRKKKTICLLTTDILPTEDLLP